MESWERYVRSSQQVPTPALEKACTIMDGFVSDKVIEEAADGADVAVELRDVGDEERAGIDFETEEGPFSNFLTDFLIMSTAGFRRRRWCFSAVHGIRASAMGV